ncbi:MULTISPECIES: antibiotic biosynthesis monooxygenase [Vagococcus]|uniref:ABM domain-containing protein n=1 Tax=Vagococcus fluvialis bH819 TaxID=1255619 RepID=A0A1X6WSG9_9ENTE|nr:MULTISPECIES: antibiotic biosynthesis monooxygenase [Vagococcus]SLM87224.1 hypothetical protein FM121_14080 [Vagococcus fluvialis bH819]HCM89110.1 antibiotic biosynthesis monooxygenase [Vagococcus sp.]
MTLVINITYTGEKGNARKFAEEMVTQGIVEAIRKEVGNEKYEYYYPMEDSESVLLIDSWTSQEALDVHHKTEMMTQIAELRKKYHLKMKVERFEPTL